MGSRASNGPQHHYTRFQRKRHTPSRFCIRRQYGDSTSANISGEPASEDPDYVARVFADRDVELLLDSGKTSGGPPSTVVEAAGEDIRLIRSGAIAWEAVQACAQHK